jgi:radical SAM-linked protein
VAEPTAVDDAAPAVTALKLRCRYAKDDKIRFVSAIDLGRLWERALRRADLPIAYSEGFSPHPKVSFPDALPLGYASSAEYAELTFAAPIDIAGGMERLNTAFPMGLRILDARAVADGSPKLAKGLQASLWCVDYAVAEADADALGAAVDAVREADELPVERQRKGAPVRIDLRPAISQISLLHPHPSTPDPQGRLRVAVVLHHLEPPVRPSEVHLALTDHFRSAASADPLPEPALVTRVAQGTATDEGVVEALSGVLTTPAPPPASP